MQFASPDALERARRVKLMIFDVDGVLTDGRLWYGPAGEEIKAFHSFDGQGLKMLAKSGVGLALLSGRSSPAVAARARELGIEHVLQGIERKRESYEALLKRLALAQDASGYMGDDLVDLPVMLRCGLSFAPADAVTEVRRRVDRVLSLRGGSGVVREMVEMVLRARGDWERVVAPFLS